MLFLMQLVQFAVFSVVFLVQFVGFLVLLVTVYLFGWAIALTVDNETGHLPYWLKWFETTDATCFDEMWVAEHPTWSKWLIATTWIMRNPVMGYCKFCAVSPASPYRYWGNLQIADGKYGVAGWFFVIDDECKWNFSYVIDLKNGHCMRGELGWYLLPLVKNIESPNVGLLQAAPFRFYEFGADGH